MAPRIHQHKTLYEMIDEAIARAKEQFRLLDKPEFQELREEWRRHLPDVIEGRMF